MLSALHRKFGTLAKMVTGSAARRPRRRRLDLETLEGRLVLSTLGPEFLVNTRTTGLQLSADNASSANGLSVAVWEHQFSPNDYDISAQLYDASGQKLGKVEYVQMGDPQAVTTQGNENQPDLVGRVGMTIFGDEREPDVPEPARSSLIRSGFIKVDGPNLLDTDRYVRSDLIASVADDTVTLKADESQILKEE